MHANAVLGPIYKFNYLKTWLDGPAAQAIQGLALSAMNYKAVRGPKRPFWGEATDCFTPHGQPIEGTSV